MPILSRNARHFGGLAALIDVMSGSMDQDRIVAVGLLTQHELTVLGPAFDRVWPVEEAPSFAELLRAIDAADRKLNGKDTEH